MSRRHETKLEEGLVGLDDWQRRWRDGETGWQAAVPKSFLTENKDKLALDKPSRVFVPLCGKTPDLIWLYGNGHSVVGSELVESPIRDLYEENGIKYSVEKLDEVECNVYKSEDGRMIIYQGDLFLLTEKIVGKVDVIWDNNSLTAINLEDRASYLELMFSLMKPESKYMLVTKEYDEAVWPGPPHSTSEEHVQQMFGERCTVEHVSTVDMVAKRETQRREAESARSRGETVSEPKLSKAQAAIATSSFSFEKAFIMQLK